VKHASLLAASLAALMAPVAVSAQHPRVDSTAALVEGADFRVYDGDGQARTLGDVIQAVTGAEAVLVGETHDDVVGHGVEAELLVRSAVAVGAVGNEGAPSRTLVLSLEMFERDVQYVLDEYLSGLITEEQFKKSARPWDRYDTDYRPMVEFARAHGIPVVAANAPRRYVNRVSRLGVDSLSTLSGLARSYLPPLPYPGPSATYTEQWNALMAEMMQEMRAPSADSAGEDVPAEGEEEAGEAEEGTPDASTSTTPEASTEATPDASTEATPDASTEAPPEALPEAGGPPVHDMGNALQAQALWDASMGEAVALHLRLHPGGLVIHYAGSFHVERGTGIPERVVDYRPGTRVLTVVLQPADDVGAWNPEEHAGLGDFVILTRKPPEVAVEPPLSRP
jgi:uncharacterized iron-regulated protein